MAAVQAARMGKSVVLVTPDKHLGGMSSSGLGFADTGNTTVIGGLAREFHHRIWQHYENTNAWNWQSRDKFGNQGQGTRAKDDAAKTMWVFEPNVAEKVFEAFIKEHRIPVYRDEWLDRTNGVQKSGATLSQITMLSGKKFAAKMFIDATYEADLMAAAGVEYHVGREAQSVYGEKWNGVKTGVLHHRHHFGMLKQPVNPYVLPGDAKSGVIFGVSAESPGEFGAGDKKIQAYCYRLCLTDLPENRVPIPKPDGYDASHYELLLRIFATGWRETFNKFDPLPNRKTDVNNHGPMSFDFIGGNYDYPEASYEGRREIIRAHQNYQQGWLYFIANDPRVPPDVQQRMKQWGLPKDEFADNGHWPHQLYIREARRMIGAYVMTEQDILKERVTPDAVGMGSYTIDSHNVQRYITPEGQVQNEGDIGVGTRGPYQIAYGALVPKREQADNLFVTACPSSSHIAFGSIRMEPVLMILGQSAATAAAMAIDEKIPVQQVSYEKLRARLLKDGQILDQPKAMVTPPAEVFFKNLNAGKKQTLVIYGTSLSAQGAWTGAMKEWFDSKYPGLVTVVNSSGSGKNSSWGVTNLQGKVLNRRPNLVFVEFSYNDAHEKFEMPVEQGAANLTQMVEAIQKRDPNTAVVLQIMNVAWDAPNGNQSASHRPQLEMFNRNYRVHAREHSLPLLDHYPNWLKLKESEPEKFHALVPDGSHPSKEGSLAITWPTVKDWLEKTQAASDRLNDKNPKQE